MSKTAACPTPVLSVFYREDNMRVVVFFEFRWKQQKKDH